jgi:hypothetical protein
MPADIGLYDWQLDFAGGVQDPGIEQVAALGTRGPGKTWLIARANIWRALQYPSTEHIIFRRNQEDVVKIYEPLLREAMADFGGVRIYHAYSSTYKCFTVACPRGGTSRIFLSFAENQKHAEKHQSAQYATASFDEVTHFEELIVALIAGSVGFLT